MSRVAIPPWTATGLLPPIDPTRPTSPERSPYFVSLPEVVLRFATSPQRRTILDGFLRYRARLHAVGLVAGFQWLDGSFLEKIEVMEGRAPRDLDVVTFYYLPSGVTQAQLYALEPGLFPETPAERKTFKSVYNVDAFLVELGAPPSLLVEMSAYWYGVWSHRRDARWKGFLAIDLNPSEDGTAAGHLAAPAVPGATP